ncbi:hypothetical protein Pr1d_43720 [Bythopirellula goksoeyrii]|uniref:Uncharacterized protein n=1 Tax=Bythopirellula goksoeyrii TaxID=1400387 RepID=A0A5B9QHC7_9BACT|nr:hypothetical protein Pr1d_43720 [Bythopirellula goksoeyrii]
MRIFKAFLLFDFGFSGSEYLGFSNSIAFHPNQATSRGHTTVLATDLCIHARHVPKQGQSGRILSIGTSRLGNLSLSDMV